MTRHLQNLDPRDQPHGRCATPIKVIELRALTVLKRGVHSQLRSSNTGVGRTPLPSVKVESSANSAEPNPPFEQSITGRDEVDSDTASDLDEGYSHAKVCDRFRPHLSPD